MPLRARTPNNKHVNVILNHKYPFDDVCLRQAYINRTKPRAVSENVSHLQIPGECLLPAVTSQDQGKICVVIDLDETLVHSSFKVRPDLSSSYHEKNKCINVNNKIKCMCLSPHQCL